MKGECVAYVVGVDGGGEEGGAEQRQRCDDAEVGTHGGIGRVGKKGKVGWNGMECC
jgi:hypothetical protein